MSILTLAAFETIEAAVELDVAVRLICVTLVRVVPRLSYVMIRVEYSDMLAVDQRDPTSSV